MSRPLSFYLSCLTILALPAYVVRFQILGLPSTLLEVLILTTLLSWIVETCRGGAKLRQIWSRVNYPFFWIGALLVAVALIQVFVSSDLRAAAGAWRAYFLEPFLFSLVLVDLGRRGDGKYFLWSLIGSGVWVGLIALAQIHAGFLVDITPESTLEVSYGRAVAVFNSGNALALFLGPLAILAAALFIKKGPLFLIPAAVFVLAIIDSKSRGGLIALLSGSLVVAAGYLILVVRPRWLRFFWLGTMSLFLGMTAAFLVFFANIGSVAPNARPENGRIYHDTGLLRLCLWEGTSNILQTAPLTGSGLAGFSQDYLENYTCDSEPLRYPHNLFLNFWTETGLAGMVIIIVMISLSFFVLGKVPDRMIALGIGGAFFYLIVHGLVDVPYFKNDLAMQWWVLLVLVSLARENKLHSS